jgi:mannose-6-phosphate isomerase-like protein (cupin superfamily)
VTDLSPTVENPITRECFTFLSSASGAQDRLDIDFVLRPGRGRPPRHRHPRQEERLTVQAGVGRFKIGKATIEAGPGQTMTVPPGVAHHFWNTGAEDLHVRVEFRPAGRQEEFFRLFCQLGKEKRTNRRGIPSPLIGTLVLRDHVADNRVVIMPTAVQRFVLPMLAQLGHLVGAEREATALRRRAGL